VPAGQLVHALSLVAEPGAEKYLPGAHEAEKGVQAEAPPPEKLPGAQAVQALAPPDDGE
jgi:hypothetical protein